MIERLLDLIGALTEATITKKLTWVLIEPDEEHEDIKPNVRDSIYEATWLDRSIKIHRKPSDFTIHLVIENPDVKLKISNDCARFLVEPLEKLYFEVYCTFTTDQEKVNNFIDGTTLSLLC